jgi:hypothetical protein
MFHLAVVEHMTSMNVRLFPLAKHIDMTIHWQALEEHILMVPLFFQGKDILFKFFSKTTSP